MSKKNVLSTKICGALPHMMPSEGEHGQKSHPWVDAQVYREGVVSRGVGMYRCGRATNGNPSQDLVRSLIYVFISWRVAWYLTLMTCSKTAGFFCFWEVWRCHLHAEHRYADMQNSTDNYTHQLIYKQAWMGQGSELHGSLPLQLWKSVQNY